MNIKVFLRDYWHVAMAVLMAVFVVSNYYMKIEYMSEAITNNSRDIQSIDRTVYVLVGIVQEENPKLNIKAYIETSAQHNIPAEAIVEGLSILKNSTPQESELYLIQNQGFTKDEATGVLKINKNN